MPPTPTSVVHYVDSPLDFPSAGAPPYAFQGPTSAVGPHYSTERGQHGTSDGSSAAASTTHLPLQKRHMATPLDLYNDEYDACGMYSTGPSGLYQNSSMEQLPMMENLTIRDRHASNDALGRFQQTYSPYNQGRIHERSASADRGGDHHPRRGLHTGDYHREEGRQGSGRAQRSGNGPMSRVVSDHSNVIAHNNDDNKRNNLYKTELCRSFEETGSCRYGGKCQFAHGQGELRVINRHPRYKTEICKTFHTVGTCPYGKRCRFIHLDGLSQYWSPSSPLSYLIPQDEKATATNEQAEVNTYFGNLRENEPCPLSPVGLSSEIRASNSGTSTPRRHFSEPSESGEQDVPDDSSSSSRSSESPSDEEFELSSRSGHDQLDVYRQSPMPQEEHLERPRSRSSDAISHHHQVPRPSGSAPHSAVSSPLLNRRLPIFQMIESHIVDGQSGAAASGSPSVRSSFPRAFSSSNLTQSQSNHTPHGTSAIGNSSSSSSNSVRMNRTFSSPSSPVIPMPGSNSLFSIGTSYSATLPRSVKLAFENAI